MGKKQVYKEHTRQGLKPQAPPLEKVAASMALLSFRCQHPPPQPTRQLPSSWEVLPAREGPGGMENRCSPSADPSLCLHQGRDGRGNACDGARCNRNRGLFPDSCSHPARMGEQGNLSQFIYLFTVLKAASCGIRYRSPTGRWTVSHGQ